MNAIEDSAFRRAWAELGRRLPRPEAILCISAHWETRGVFLTAAEAPPTIHDFYGFPRELFAVRYPAPGQPALARRVASMLGGVGERPSTPARGLDHGCWSVLVAMYPEADVPVVQLSLDSRQPAAVPLRAREAARSRCATPACSCSAAATSSTTWASPTSASSGLRLGRALRRRRCERVSRPRDHARARRLGRAPARMRGSRSRRPSTTCRCSTRSALQHARRRGPSLQRSTACSARSR